MLLILLVLGCVPKKDFDALSAELDKERVAHGLTTDTLSKSTTDLATATAEVERLRGVEAGLARDLDEARKQLDGERGQWEKEKAALVSDKSKLKASVAEMEGALREAAERRGQAEARVKEFKDLLARFQKLIDAGQLKVKIVDGRMVVELATDILFASGKADLSEAGKTSLAQVGSVLATITDRSFQVEGHTDNVPIQTEKFPSNWELASARAILVVKTLTAAGVPAGRISAASFADTRPVGDNATLDGRVANRRIEIVVVPDLSQLPGFDELKAAAK